MSRSPEEIQTVTLVFVDHHEEELTVSQAEARCSDPVISGYIMDALTDDRELQSYLRDLIDQG